MSPLSHSRLTSQPSTLPTRWTRRAVLPSSSTCTTRPGRRTERRPRPLPIPGLPSPSKSRCSRALTRRRRTPRERRAPPAGGSILPWRWAREGFIIDIMSRYKSYRTHGTVENKIESFSSRFSIFYDSMSSNCDLKYGAKVLGQLCDSRTSYISSVTISASANNFLS